MPKIALQGDEASFAIRPVHAEGREPGKVCQTRQEKPFPGATTFTDAMDVAMGLLTEQERRLMEMRMGLNVEQMTLAEIGEASITKTKSEATATTEAKAKPGQRRPAASEVECTA